VGSLVYLTATRPHIAHAVHILSKFGSAPTSVHFGHLLRGLRYLRGTSSQCLFNAHDSPLCLHAYSDATCHWLLYFSWIFSSCIESKKQSAVSRSSTEEELCALATTTCEIIWL
jgi:hypothetical protein